MSGWMSIRTECDCELPEFVRVVCDGIGRDYVPERTCTMTRIGGDALLAGWWKCSECGPVFPPCDEKTAKGVLRHCPMCGARVVDE